MTTTDDDGRPTSGPAPTDRPGQTRKRQIRLDDSAYYSAVARAKRDGKSIGRVTERLLERYGRGELDV